MDAIGHQYVGVQKTLMVGESLAQPMQVGLVVFLPEEAGFAVVAALHDVQRNLVKLDAGAARHTVR